MNTAELNNELPWYTNGFVWMLIAFPLAAVVAGFYTLYLAIVSYDGLVADDYYKQGLAINKRLEKQQLATQMGIQAQLQISDNGQHVLVNLSSDEQIQYPHTLPITLSHSTRQGHDQETVLNHLGNIHYSGDIQALIPGSWIVSIETDAWRVDKVLLQP